MGVEDAEERELRAMKIAHGINRCIWGLLSSIHQMQCEATQSKYKGDERRFLLTHLHSTWEISIKCLPLNRITLKYESI